MSDSPRLHAFVRRRPSGWPQAMHVVATPDGAIVHSPTRIDDATFDAIDGLASPRWLFAPNHFHHLGLPAYRARYPHAEAIAARGALPRLTSKGHASLVAAEEASLPRGVRVLVPEGTKSGEAWLAIDEGEGTTWIVCDAFFHETAPVRGLEGMFLRAAKITPGLAIGRTFTMLCLRDAGRYATWVRTALLRERPRRVLFSHGDPLEERATEELVAVLDRRLPGPRRPIAGAA